MDDQDRLLATQPDLLLGKWIRDARAFGNDSAGKAYYEKNARVEKFFDILRSSIKNDTPLNMEAINKEMAAFEWSWTNQQTVFNAEPQGNPLTIVKELHKKYYPLFDICND